MDLLRLDLRSARASWPATAPLVNGASSSLLVGSPISGPPLAGFDSTRVVTRS